MQFNCVKKTTRKTELNVLLHSTAFPSGLSVFWSFRCVFFCVWLWWIKPRKTEETVRFSAWTAHFCVWKTTGKDSSEACAIACQNCAVYSVFPAGMTSPSKIAQFNWQCIGRLTNIVGYLLFSMALKPTKSKLSILTRIGSIWRQVLRKDIMPISETSASQSVYISFKTLKKSK